MRNSGTVFTALLLRDGACCYLCGQRPDLEDPLEIEHVQPKTRGGTGDLGDLTNLRLAHRSCNRRKGTNLVNT